jgi:hypothetical protein
VYRTDASTRSVRRRGNAVVLVVVVLTVVVVLWADVEVVAGGFTSA